jgi:hypothetical protein
MTFDTFKSIFRTTLRDPRQGGKDVIALNWPVQGLWIALMLMAVLLSLLVSGLLHISPMPPDELGQLVRMSPAYHAPLLFAVINWGQSVITVFVLHWISQMVGGQGQLRDMLSVMIWLQIMTLAMALAFFTIAMLLPSVGGFFMLLAFFWGLWAMIALVDAASGFNSMFKALGVCIAALLVFSFGMTIFSALIGGLAIGGVGNV